MVRTADSKLPKENVLATAVQTAQNGPQGNVTGILAVIRHEIARFAEDRNLRKRLAELEQREPINTTETNALEED